MKILKKIEETKSCPNDCIIINVILLIAYLNKNLESISEKNCISRAIINKTAIKEFIRILRL